MNRVRNIGRLFTRRGGVGDRVRFYSRPVLRNPTLVAAWPGIGDVALIVVRYLKDKLKAEEFAELEASSFFEPGGIIVRDNVVETPHFPASKFYCWRNPKAEHDLILFVGEEQPTTKAYDLANTVLKVGLQFKVRRVYTCAAALARIHHTEKPKVWMVATRQELLTLAERHNLVLNGNIQIAGLNGLLLGATKERGLDGLSLLGEVPVYATRMSHPNAALSVLEALTAMLDIQVDMTDLSNAAKEASEEMKKLASEAMGEFIQHFTQPLWEQNPPEGE